LLSTVSMPDAVADGGADADAGADAPPMGSTMSSSWRPALNASGWRLIALAPASNARCVLAMYSSREGAGRSVVMEIRPLSKDTPRSASDWRVLVEVVLMVWEMRMAVSARVSRERRAGADAGIGNDQASRRVAGPGVVGYELWG